MADILVARSREINTTFADSGVTTLESLQAKRAALATANAALWARYGDGGTFGQKRDNLFAVIAIEKRNDLEANAPLVTDSKGNTKKAAVTEPMVEAAVRVDPRYTKCIDDAESERARFYLNNNAIKDLDEKMFRDNAIIRYLTTEPKV
jgi:hypothetical protein